ncbi:O-antigen ligase [Rhizobacter sp. Root1221]|uniref:O-antigen ligase family protein n=1 Tax=Rhizobacter sp. Root1221 TaxID=1736433 RepID=UPI0009E6F067|nr:O-antigen ligase family protein [Rhizobacter sp. Root1221]
MERVDLQGAGARGPAPVRKSRFDLLQMLLVGMIVYIPNQTQFPVEFSIKGLNIVNVMFLWTWFLLAKRQIHTPTPAPLRGGFYFTFFVLALSFLIGQMYDASLLMEDVTALKNMIFFMLLYFLYYRAVQDVKTIRLLFAVILFVTFVASIQGLRQALDYGIASYNETRRVSAPFGWGVSNANRAAVFFAIFLPLFAAVGLFYRDSGKVRAVAYACLALGVFVVFFTYSRQTYFILAALAMFLTLKKNWFIAVIIAVVLLNFESWAPDTVVERIMSTEQKEAPPAASAAAEGGAGEGKYDESTESRFIIWAAAGELISERPWGIGLNHFKREIGTYAPRYKNMDAHNNYVLITTEAGLLGPVALLIMLGSMFFLGRRTERINGSVEAKVLGVGFTVSVVAVAMGNIYGSRFFDGDVMGNFWILAALVARYGTLQKELAVKEAAPAAGKRARPSMYA